MSLQLSQAVRAVLDRIEYVMRLQIEGELTLVCPSGLEVPKAPTDGDCYLLAEALGQQILTSGVALIVESYASSSIANYQSGTGDECRAVLTIPVRVRILFNRLGQASYTRPSTSRPCSFEELLQLASEVYKGAILNIIYRDVQAPDLIESVNVTRNHSGATLIPSLQDGSTEYAGVALVEFDVVTTVTLPAPRRVADPGAAL